MASDKNGNKKHKCSCGRAFRHAISLKRHQKVAGCDPVVEEVQELVVEAVAEVAELEVARAEITAIQVAAWQRERGFIAPEPPKQPLVDWDAVRRTSEDFIDFLHESKNGAVGFFSNVVYLGARLGLFGMVIMAMGWVVLSGRLMATPAAAANTQHATLAAQTVVENFLQTAQLKQYGRARSFLTTSAQQSVTASQLEQMMAGLPLNQTPEHWNAELETAGRAKVTVHRAGVDEVYTLVQENHGWSLCSVSVSRG